MPELINTVSSTLPNQSERMTANCTLRPAFCATRDVSGMLRRAGLRPTRQRVFLGRLLYANGHRHVTAETLYEEAKNSEIGVSLATIYNALNQFTEAGLLRELAVDGSRAWFDTNVSEHHHFFLEDENRVVDIPGSTVDINGVDSLPDGMEIARVDVIVRLRRKSSD
ncbi:Iron transcriptional regulator protein [Hyphomicrobium sp. MC1]|nr:Iron transcriptional regulator protein [Hyphomicrobium sp. MC1]